jgi:hypothetical protein
LFVEPEWSNIERMKLALKDAIAFHIDILTRLREVFRFADLETERVPFEDLTVTVVTPRMLYRMKRDTVRPKDKADAAAVRERFRLEE